MFDTHPRETNSPDPNGPRGLGIGALDSSHPGGVKPSADQRGEYSQYRRDGHRMTLMEHPVLEREALLVKIEHVIERKLRAAPRGIKVAKLVRDVGTEVGCYEDEVFIALARLETRTQGDEIQALGPLAP